MPLYVFVGGKKNKYITQGTWLKEFVLENTKWPVLEGGALL